MPSKRPAMFIVPKKEVKKRQLSNKRLLALHMLIVYEFQLYTVTMLPANSKKNVFRRNA